MPFQSEKQRRYLWANEPEIARDWTDTYGSGIAKALGGRIGYQDGTLTEKQIAMIKDMKKKGMDTSTIETITGATAGQINSVINAPAQRADLSSRGIMDTSAANQDFKFDKSAMLKQYLEGDPLRDVYNLDPSLIKQYAQDPEQGLSHQKGTLGYTYPYGQDEALYIRDIDKFQPKWTPGATQEGQLNKQIGETIGHEARHQLLADNPEFEENINDEMFRTINEERAQTDNYKKFFDPDYEKRGDVDKHELLNRMLDFQAYNDPSIYRDIYQDMHGDMPRHLSSPIADAFSDQATGFTNKMLSPEAVGPRPHQGMIPPTQYGKRQTQDDDDQQSWWRSLFSPKSIMRGASSYLANKAGLGIFAGLPGMALSMFGGGNRGPVINPATKQFMQNYGVGRDPQTGRMTSGPFAGKNLPGTSMFGSKTPKEMAQKWLDKFEDVDYKTKDKQQKKQLMKNIVTMNQGPAGITPRAPVSIPVPAHITGGNGGVNGGTGGGFSGAGAGTGASGPPGRNYNRGGLAALWPR